MCRLIMFLYYKNFIVSHHKIMKYIYKFQIPHTLNKYKNSQSNLWECLKQIYIYTPKLPNPVF